MEFQLLLKSQSSIYNMIYALHASRINNVSGGQDQQTAMFKRNSRTQRWDTISSSWALDHSSMSSGNAQGLGSTWKLGLRLSPPDPSILQPLLPTFAHLLYPGIPASKWAIFGNCLVYDRDVKYFTF